MNDLPQTLDSVAQAPLIHLPRLGVVLVTFNSADVILDCLESLLAATEVLLEIIVVDNASTDATLVCLRDWAAGLVPYVPPADMPFALQPCAKPILLDNPGQRVGAQARSGITLIEADVNGGFAAGVNRGLANLSARPEIDRFWILNPDSAVPPGAAYAFATEPGPTAGFSLMGGRVVFLDHPSMIQIDGGLINWRTGVTGNIALGQALASTPPPDPASLDFITGASMVVSRAFYERAGPMAEDYFLYYEEVDWALRRLTLPGGELPLAYCPGGIVYHRAGTAIGSPTLGRPASPFSLYFKHRGRLRFMRRFRARNLLFAYAYSFAKAAQLALKGYWTEARTVILASFDRPPPAEVRARLSPEAAELAFAKPSKPAKP
jgi:GT2 family glycosyltransferase